ncbi:MAG: alpha/beta fold hydrolase [Jatrophihabitans sp.]
MNTAFELTTGPIAALDNSIGAGPAAVRGVVLLVPGYTGSKEDFMPLLRPLAAGGYRAVAIDQRGQYQSGWSPTAAGYQLDALASDLCELADQLIATGNALHLVGHSFGGLVSRAAVLAAPQLFADLVLMGSGPSGIQGARRAALDAGEPVLAEHGMGALWQQLQARSQADPRYVRPAPAVQAFLQARFMATDPISLQVMGTTLRDTADRSDQLAALGKPLLVLHGVDDDAWPPAVQVEMAARLGAAYAVIERAAHSPAVENPADTIRALIDFWQVSQA